MQYQFTHAIIAGTFDHLHAGHKQFIAAAFTKAEQVHISITKQLLTTNKQYMNSVQSYETRKKSLEAYLDQHGLSDRATLYPLSDIFGMAVQKNACEAIFVTDDTKANAILINAERRKRHLPQLTIVTVPLRIGDDHLTISSSRIRSGETDREGNSYETFFLGKQHYLLPANLRKALQQPIGTIVTTENELKRTLKNHIITTIGDIVSQTVLKAGYTPVLSVIDYHTRRHPIERQTLPKILQTPDRTINNPHGTINKQFAKTYREALRRNETKTYVIAISGEEDLLALPALLLAPIDSLVIYGQYKVGMVVVTITEEIKDYARTLLREF
jgi:cytidyltransferase-like protein